MHFWLKNIIDIIYIVFNDCLAKNTETMLSKIYEYSEKYEDGRWKEKSWLLLP